jgi:hypothetical protein
MNYIINLKNSHIPSHITQALWFMPIISATREEVIRKIMVQGHPGQKQLIKLHLNKYTRHDRALPWSQLLRKLRKKIIVQG